MTLLGPKDRKICSPIVVNVDVIPARARSINFFASDRYIGSHFRDYSAGAWFVMLSIVSSACLCAWFHFNLTEKGMRALRRQATKSRLRFDEH